MTARNRHDEGGAALIIALVFILTMGLLTGVLVTLASTNLAATTNLEAQRVGQYAADGALEVAVQSIRYPAGTNCDATTGLLVTIPTSGSDEQLTVYCATAPLVGARQDTFWVCPSKSVSDCQKAAEGQPITPTSSIIAQATVLYNDVEPGCIGDLAFCSSRPDSKGRSVTVEAWSVTSANG
jgi:Tfp pilus assembly protein PilX